ncbi:MAG: helix-turn-helix domain-containing protein [Alphaproteobacteria bacterium]|nr:helix-turn-helix domain-containing protein [Alphaproteobacteria bacterium]
MADDHNSKKEYLGTESEDLLRDFHTDLSVGDILQRARIRLNVTLEQISHETHIQVSYLEAIEEGQLDKLPGRIYALGFIKTYAEYLNLDGDKIIQLLKRQSGKKVEPKPLSSTLPVDEDHSVPEFKTVLIIFVLLAAGLTLYSFSFGSTEKQKTIPGVPNDLKEQVTLLTKPQAVAKKNLVPNEKAISESEENLEPSLPEQIDHHPVVLKAIENVWLEIRTPEKKVILSRVLSKGEEYWVPEDQTNLVMTLGNAGGLEIVVDGETLPFLGRKGQVIRSLSLNLEYLKDLLKKTSKQSM